MANTTKQSFQTKSLQSTQVQTPPIQSTEVMYYVDSRGLVGIMIIVVLEMATPIGLLFPTDAIVFGGGMYFSAKGTIRGGIWMIMALFSFAVVMGDLLGYRLGSLLSPKLQTMEDNWIFKKKYIRMCQDYFDEYGDKTMLISKFLPIRSIIPLVAGVILKPFIPFFLQSILSAILWVGSLLGISYFIIRLIPEAANHIGLLTFLFVIVPQVVSVRYMILPMMKKYEERAQKASENIHHIAEEVSVIGSQFVAIGHEVKELVNKMIYDDHVTTPNTITSTPQIMPPSTSVVASVVTVPLSEDKTTISTPPESIPH